MTMTDPVADFLSRIRNAILAKKDEVVCPRSGLKFRIAEILRKEGFIDDVNTGDGCSGQGTISVTLRWQKNRNAIDGLRRVSRPGQQWYVGAKDLPKVRNGLGIAIVSTSKGVMTDKEARKLGVGGEVLCEIW